MFITFGYLVLNGACGVIGIKHLGLQHMLRHILHIISTSIGKQTGTHVGFQESQQPHWPQMMQILFERHHVLCFYIQI
jgi:hypothetical protein